jgi:UDP-N-acetylglucosamine--N-acetylmuramyl-(pentapeptide) pyrophosphoryl-undecaprenol N-acetylglucosamine transferase
MISGGGTGGHVYPILAVVEALIRESATRKSGNRDFGCPNSLITDSLITDFLYIGSRGGVEEEIVSREGLPFTAISTGGLRGLAPWIVAGNLFKMMAGFAQSLGIVRRFAPDAVLVTGGYVCAPVALATRLSGVPLLIFLPDMEPGLAIRALSRLATRVAVSFPDAAKYFAKTKVVTAGYPVRAEFFAADKAGARKAFGLEEGLKTITVFGGSRGAHRINLALSECLDHLLEVCQVIHICGPLDAEWVIERRGQVPDRLRNRYRAYPYLYEEMPGALAAADLAVARAGAATLGEFPALGLPSILVPYPYAGQHQEVNADYLVSRGAAVKIADADLNEKLFPTISSLLSGDALAKMSDRARALAQPQAAQCIAEELRQIGTRD